MKRPVQRYVCVHGHFYQPCRENPWLGAIEPQDSAYPYHDWNERITAECYAPNAAARILDEHERIREIVNNYARMSFDFGPTLLADLARRAPDVHAAIVEADRLSRGENDGHGSALAQGFGHAILPLCSPRDRRTHVRWGLADFAWRFGRPAEGLWLPETAVDLDTLEALAEAGVRFTLLAPHQAARVRLKGDAAWREVEGEGVDPGVAYEQPLPSGRTIALFFYDGPLARAVAFERLLDHGEAFARRLLAGLDARDGGPRLSHLAADGETYGHHHRFGEMALAYALDRVAAGGSAARLNYAAFLARHPPRHEVEVRQNTSWSCTHGVERWRADCGCGGGRPGWTQAWRAPLREALDHLGARLAALFEERAGRLLADPWGARDAYVDVLLDGAGESRERFLSTHALRPPAPEERVAIFKLLELQRHALLMFTSCGWFFDDLAGLEAVQVLRHAARAVHLAREVAEVDLEPPLLSALARARSNDPDRGDGARVWRERVLPAAADLPRVAANRVVRALFEPDLGPLPPADPLQVRRLAAEPGARSGSELGAAAPPGDFALESELWRERAQGRARLVTLRARVRSRVTEERADLSVAVLHLGDPNLAGGVRAFPGGEGHDALTSRLFAALEAGDLAEVVRRIDAELPELRFSLNTLLGDEQRSVLRHVLAAAVEEAAAHWRRHYDEEVGLIRLLAGLSVPLPLPLRAAAQVVTDERLRAALSAVPPDPVEAARLAEEARCAGVPLDGAGLALVLERALEREMELLPAAPQELPRLERLAALAALARGPSIHANLWRAQNRFYRLLQSLAPAADGGEGEWVRALAALGEALGVRVARRDAAR